jgi:hypothetical protein
MLPPTSPRSTSQAAEWRDRVLPIWVGIVDLQTRLPEAWAA